MQQNADREVRGRLQSMALAKHHPGRLTGALVAMVFLAISALPLAAQTTSGTVSGSVKDPPRVLARTRSRRKVRIAPAMRQFASK